MPRGFTEKEKEEITLKLIRKGRTLFARFGYDKTSLDKIVDACGIAKGSFYRFFPNKETLFIACLADLEAEIDEKVIGPLIDNASTPEELLTGLMDLALNTFSRFPLLRAWFETPSKERIMSVLGDGEKELMNGEDTRRMNRVLGKIVELGGECRCSAEDLASLFRSLFFLSEHREMISTDFSRYARQLAGILTRGLLP